MLCLVAIPFYCHKVRFNKDHIQVGFLRKDFVIPCDFNSTAQPNSGTTLVFIKYVREEKKRIKMNEKKKLKSFNAKREGKHDAKALKNEKKKIEK